MCFFQQRHRNVSCEKRHEITVLHRLSWRGQKTTRWRRRKDFFPDSLDVPSLWSRQSILNHNKQLCWKLLGEFVRDRQEHSRRSIGQQSEHINQSSPAYTHVCPHQSKEGFSPQSKASCSSLTRLACPGSLNRPSSRRPHCLMKSTHCSTSIGASLFPNRRSYRTVSSNFWPKIPGTQNDLHLLEKGQSALGDYVSTPFLSVIYKLWCL